MNDEPRDTWQTESPLTQPVTEVNAPVVEPEPVTTSSPSEDISWAASEYIHHEKDGKWFAAVIGVGLVLTIVSFLLLQSLTFTVLLVVMIVATVVLGSRPPMNIPYHLTDSSIQIGERTFTYDEFKAFGIVNENEIYSLMLIPVKRLRPAVSIFFPPDQGEEIIDKLNDRIPMIEIKPALIDAITRKLRF